MAKKMTKAASEEPNKKTATKPAAYAGPVLVLKTTKDGGVPHWDGTDSGRNKTAFRWPRSGSVVAPDWDPSPKCGGGLHALEFGEGSWKLLQEDETGSEEWRVVLVQDADLVRLTDNGDVKVKFRTGEVVYCGNKAEAMARVMCGKETFERAKLRAISYSSTAASSGDYSTAASSGDSSTAASSGDYSKAASSGYSSKAASSGDYSNAASSGDSSNAASSGYYSKAASSGYSSKAASSGDYSKAASSGDSSTAASSGDSSKAASSGYYSTAASSGDSSTAASSGYYSTAASSGNSSNAASSGNSSTAASSGNSSTAASSGYYSTAASSGDSSKAASSGDYSKAEQKGESGIAASIGNGGRAKAGENGLLIVTWLDEPAKRFRACVGEVGIDGIEADVWYRAEGGKLVKA